MFNSANFPNTILFRSCIFGRTKLLNLNHDNRHPTVKVFFFFLGKGRKTTNISNFCLFFSMGRKMWKTYYLWDHYDRGRIPFFFKSLFYIDFINLNFFFFTHSFSSFVTLAAPIAKKKK